MKKNFDKQFLEAKSLRKAYNGRPVVRNVDVNIKSGEIVGLMGPNGAGKTTCFYMISGLIQPDGGQIIINGQNITSLPMYRRARMGIGYLPQETSVFRGLNVEENIMAILELTDIKPKLRKQKLDELLEEFSIAHLRTASSITLSGGERRRLEIARAIASDPVFILLDEPLAGIDPIAVIEIKQLISHLKDRGIGVLITDHNVREMLDIIDRGYIMNDGGVIMEGTPEEIIENEMVRNVYLGSYFKL